MLNWLDGLLGRITMYRLLLYVLITWEAVAVLLSGFGVLSFNPLWVLFSAAYLVGICYISNKVLAWAFDAPTNYESALLTGLILGLIVTPIANPKDLVFLTAVAGLAMASKYLLAIRKKHIFNPAAIAVVLTAFGAKQPASWWIGTGAMLPFVVIGGLLVVRKIQREQMVLGFLAAATAGLVISAILRGSSVAGTLHLALLSSPLIYFAFIMLTEPLTSPPTKDGQVYYGAMVGALFTPALHIGSIFSTPELALVLGNLFAYAISPKTRLLPQLTQKIRLAPDTYDFVFTKPDGFWYNPGQYMEWILPHKQVDGRGNRRYFTLSSSPTEENLRLGVKFYTNGSSYKRAMQEMNEQTKLAAGQLAGQFTLPKDPSQKLAFVAGGIGVTPYRSHVKYLLDKGEKRDVVLLYGEKNHKELAYTDIFEQARKQIGMKSLYVLSDEKAADSRFRSGFITKDLVMAEIPDYGERLFYVSGPHSMVVAVKKALRELGVPNKHIKTDFFPGYA